MISILMEKNEVAVAGDLAMLRVTWQETITPKGEGDPLDLGGNWLLVLRKQPEMKLVLAHSGGGWGWVGTDRRWERSFARQAFNLCVTFDNVYCDFGYMDEVLDNEGQTRLRDRLLDIAGTDEVSGEEYEALSFDDCLNWFLEGLAHCGVVDYHFSWHSGGQVSTEDSDLTRL